MRQENAQLGLYGLAVSAGGFLLGLMLLPFSPGAAGFMLVVTQGVALALAIMAPAQVSQLAAMVSSGALLFAGVVLGLPSMVMNPAPPPPAPRMSVPEVRAAPTAYSPPPARPAPGPTPFTPYQPSASEGTATRSRPLPEETTPPARPVPPPRPSNGESTPGELFPHVRPKGPSR